MSDLPLLCEKLKADKVIIYADPSAYQALEGHYPAGLLKPATPESFGTEFLDYKMAIKTVNSFENALGHIQEYSSRHSESIVTENPERAALFTRMVDAACVYTNVSTAFTDGAQFGLGAEIGISTQKLHARGPMAVFDYIDGRDFEKPELWEGMSARTTNTSLGLSLLYDSRDFLTNAYQGYYLRIDQRFSPAFLGNKYAFSSTELTTSYYHPVWKGGVLAGQFHTLLNYGNPPWGLMATLGSSYSMRGYYEGRYRDKCAMDAQIELRQHIWKRNGVAVWAGAGTVFPRFSDFTSKHILPNYGFGYRWEFKKRVNVRLDLGFGKHQTGFIFNINEAF